MNTRTFLAAVILAASLVACAPEPPAPARDASPEPATAGIVVSAAVARAAAEGKSVLIEFGASWCVWCRHFESFVKAPDTGPVLARHFVIVNLTVQERDDKKALENPGGLDAMVRWGGEKSGLPFYVFLDGRGENIATSNAMPNGGNIGFPAVPAEIDAFLTVIGRAPPKLTASERSTLREYLVKNMPEPSGT
jgi:thiol:disulfide interchange protein